MLYIFSAWCKFNIDTTIIPSQIHPKELFHNICSSENSSVEWSSESFNNRISIAKTNETLSFCTMTHYSQTRHIYLPIKETYSFLAAILNLLLVFMRGLKGLIMLSDSKIMCTYSFPLESDDTYQFFDAFMWRIIMYLFCCMIYDSFLYLWCTLPLLFLKFVYKKKLGLHITKANLFEDFE